MIEILKQQFSPSMNSEEKISRSREFLQILCLKIIYDKGYFKHLAFVGGTAIRVLYDLRRFSEDLDFSVIKNASYDFKEFISGLEYELKLHGLNIETKNRIEKSVQSSFIKFTNILAELGLSQLKEQRLSVKIEVDSNPPQGWKAQKTLINKTYIFTVMHFDLPSLYATKLHACFFRKYIKGRDYYDLLWYLGRKVEPNFTLLNNAIQQTEGQDLKLNKANFRDFLLGRLSEVDFSFVRKDVERFLEDKKELNLLSFDSIKQIINSEGWDK